MILSKVAIALYHEVLLELPQNLFPRGIFKFDEVASFDVLRRDIVINDVSQKVLQGDKALIHCLWNRSALSPSDVQARDFMVVSKVPGSGDAQIGKARMAKFTVNYFFICADIDTLETLEEWLVAWRKEGLTGEYSFMMGTHEVELNFSVLSYGFGNVSRVSIPQAGTYFSLPVSFDVTTPIIVDVEDAKLILEIEAGVWIKTRDGGKELCCPVERIGGLPSPEGLVAD